MMRATMKRAFVLFFAAAALAGCTSFSATRDAWLFSPSESLPQAKITLDEAEVAALKQRQTELRAQYNSTRVELARGASPRERVPTYIKLDDIGVPLEQTERRLWVGGRAGE